MQLGAQTAAACLPLWRGEHTLIIIACDRIVHYEHWLLCGVDRNRIAHFYERVALSSRQHVSMLLCYGASLLVLAKLAGACCGCVAAEHPQR